MSKRIRAIHCQQAPVSPLVDTCCKPTMWLPPPLRRSLLSRPRAPSDRTQTRLPQNVSEFYNTTCVVDASGSSSSRSVTLSPTVANDLIWQSGDDTTHDVISQSGSGNDTGGPSITSMTVGPAIPCSREIFLRVLSLSTRLRLQLDRSQSLSKRRTAIRGNQQRLPSRALLPVRLRPPVESG